MSSENMASENIGGTGLTLVTVVIIAVCGVVVLWAFTLCIVCFCCCRKKKPNTANLEAGKNPKAVDNGYTNPVAIPLTPNTPVPTGATRFGLQDLLGISLGRLILDESRLKMGKEIGRGQFGQVYEAKLARKGASTLKVAVKTVNNDTSEDKVRHFLEESLRMRGFAHRNVLSIIGLVFKNDLPYVVLPFMDHGDLRTYISKHHRTFTVLELLGYGTQVSDGMCYLSEQGFVHRDLAARNCMLNKDHIVKVADFGLSRDLNLEYYYRQSDLDTPVPIRWMAVESLTSQVYSHKSDVWSFGVLLWEILTRGQVPYAGLKNIEVKTAIMNGRRLEKPSHLPDEVFQVMQRCWKDDPKDRPTFEDLSEDLHKIVDSGKKGSLNRSSVGK